MVDEDKLWSAFVQFKTVVEAIEEKTKELESRLKVVESGIAAIEQELWGD